ncbi:hypothetical protein O181_122930 [Austropuccinia psidii MF-1]|uniref:Uncharacterized protein n=1 Tax=Austropuccinia psidii MF-1 TaxID=1389203 RepID=A0A9Q3KKA0_9BASI|nr:hypothetical protein [Austropuccinia psidii MF-1]
MLAVSKGNLTVGIFVCGRGGLCGMIKGDTDREPSSTYAFTPIAFEAGTNPPRLASGSLASRVYGTPEKEATRPREFLAASQAPQLVRGE